MDKYHLLRRSGILGLIEISLPLLVQKRFGTKSRYQQHLYNYIVLISTIKILSEPTELIIKNAINPLETLCL